MNKDLLLGILLGLIASFVGTYLYVSLFTDFNLIQDYKLLNFSGLLGKVITLGTILSVLTFIFFFYKKKDSIAKGVLISVIALVILTFFV
ncbi:hypothetical protein [Flavobacterium sp.]|uniref:hypothetical protein n=1 Tax=Flavobacterium sp. TaxID=239 RepID=UPI002B4ADDAF|nr:hypothetical protein [Flavobacterium sp.]HLP64052.1 hypothetical protein [Flavobacterium sp.]